MNTKLIFTTFAASIFISLIGCESNDLNKSETSKSEENIVEKPRYSKICLSGEIAGTGSCPIDPILGNKSDNWGCTKDNYTNLTWEIKTNDGGFHDWEWHYSWYEPDNTKNTGVPGGKTKKFQDTNDFLTHLNDVKFCGFNDWRLPKVTELYSLICKASIDYVDSAYKISGIVYPICSKNSQFISSNLRTNSVPYTPEINFFPEYRPSPNVFQKKEYWTIENRSSLAYKVDLNTGWTHITSKEFYTGHQIIAVRSNNYSKSFILETEISSVVTDILKQKERFEIGKKNISTIIDKSRKLMWRRCSEGQNMIFTPYCDSNGSTTRFTKKEATIHVGEVNKNAINTYNDWRIPTNEELESLVESVYLDIPDGITGMINKTSIFSINWLAFPGTPKDKFLSSSGEVISFDIQYEKPVFLKNVNDEKSYLRLVRNYTDDSENDAILINENIENKNDTLEDSPPQNLENDVPKPSLPITVQQQTKSTQKPQLEILNCKEFEPNKLNPSEHINYIAAGQPKERVYFYNAPDTACKTKTYIISGDHVSATEEYQSDYEKIVFIKSTYTNPKTGKSVSGWIRADSLQFIN
jgi:hypothetical protein